MEMWENGVNLSWGSVAMWGCWVSALGLIGAGWMFQEPHLGQAGLASSALAAAFTVIRDNARTRRVVRALARERDAEGMRVV